MLTLTRMYRSAQTALFAVLLSTSAYAGTLYSLKNDFSSINNPNGVWSFLEQTSALSWQTSQVTSTLDPALPTGYWGTGSNLKFNTPEIFQAAVNGSQAGESDQAFLAGDIVAHSSNDITVPFIIQWTAPQSGNIAFSGSIWYAHASRQTRSNEFSFTYNGGAPLAAGTVTSANWRSNALTFNSNGEIAVQAGDVLSLTLYKSIGQTYGSLNGVDINILYGPEPGTWLMLASGFSLLLIRRRRS